MQKPGDPIPLTLDAFKQVRDWAALRILRPVPPGNEHIALRRYFRYFSPYGTPDKVTVRVLPNNASRGRFDRFPSSVCSPVPGNHHVPGPGSRRTKGD